MVIAANTQWFLQIISLLSDFIFPSHLPAYQAAFRAFSVATFALILRTTAAATISFGSFQSQKQVPCGRRLCSKQQKSMTIELYNTELF